MFGFNLVLFLIFQLIGSGFCLKKKSLSKVEILVVKLGWLVLDLDIQFSSYSLSSICNINLEFSLEL